MRTLASLIVAFSALSTARGDSISLSAMSYVGEEDNQTPCSTSQSSTSPGTVTASCGGANAYVISSATYSGLFSGSVSVEEQLPFLASQSGQATVKDSSSEYLLVTGGTGTGTLTLDFLATGSGAASDLTYMNFVTNFGSIDSPYPDCGPMGVVCTWQFTANPLYQSVTGYAPTSQTIVIPFTFGVPVLFTEMFTLDGEENDPEGPFAMASAQIEQTGFSVTDSNGNAVPGAQLTIVPEPSTALLFAIPAAILIAGNLRRVFGVHPRSSAAMKSS
jgi:hypothetical protein